MKRLLSVLLALMLVIAVLPVSALAATTKTVYVSRNGGNSRINLRTGAGYDYPESGNTVKHNAKVTVQSTSSDGEWTKVKVNSTGKSGWIRTYYIDGTTKALGTGAHIITKATKVYAKADTKTKVKGSLAVGDTVKVFYTEKDFASVTVTGSSLKGWIPMRVIGDEVALSPEKPSSSSKTVYHTTASVLNLRKGAGTGYAIIGKLPFGTGVTVLEKKGNWWKVKTFNNQTGWVSKNYLSKETTARVATNGSNLNIRKGPGTNTAVLGSLKNGTKVTVNSTSGNWAYISYGKLKGWMSLNWLKF